MSKNDYVDIILLSNFIHQVINPLNSIAGTLDNIADGTTEPGKVKQKAAAARAQIELISNLVRNLAYLTQIVKNNENQERPPEKENVNITELCIESTMIFQESARKSNIAVELKRNNDGQIIRHPSIENLLRQVVMNILDNATKYADKDSKVFITCKKSSEDDLIIEIENIGCGFSHNERDNIFELNFRGTDAKAKTASGSGLGLHICKLIVENILQGKINPEYNKSTRLTKFSVRIPK